MPRPLPRERWLVETAARFAGLDTWRQAHPTATWTEIEAAVDAQLGPLRAQLVGETAVASDATDLRGERRRNCANTQPDTDGGRLDRRRTGGSASDGVRTF
jgi:hypothetical protein